MKKIILTIIVLGIITGGIVWVYNKKDSGQDKYQAQNMNSTQNTQENENKTEDMRKYNRGIKKTRNSYFRICNQDS